MIMIMAILVLTRPTCHYLSTYLQLDDVVSAFAGYTFNQGRLRLFCNGRFSECFMSSDEMAEKFSTLSALPDMIWSW